MTFNMVQLSLIAEININLDITAPIVSQKHTEYRVKNEKNTTHLHYFTPHPPPPKKCLKITTTKINSLMDFL